MSEDKTIESKPVKVHETKQQKILKLIFLALGISSLLPFNCIIVPVDYYVQFYESWFLTVASLCYNGGNFLCTILMTFVGYKWKQSPLIFCSLIGWCICLVAIPIIKLVDDQIARSYITLVPIIIAGILNGFFFPSVIGIASMIDRVLVTQFSAGNGIAALIPQFLYIILKAIVGSSSTSEDSLFYQTLTYFIVAGLWMILSIAIYIYLLRLKLPQMNQISHKDTENLLSSSEQYVPKTPFPQLFRHLATSTASILLIFWCTLSIFPTITTLVPCNNLARKDKLNSDDGWWSICFMTVFMIFDYISRSFPGWVPASFKLSKKWCLILTILRIPLFFTLFLLEALPKYNCDEDGADCTDGPYIPSDVVSMLTMLIFAWSNGFLNTIVMVNYSSDIQEQDKSQASSIMGFMLNSGLFLGGLTSLCIGIPLNQ